MKSTSHKKTGRKPGSGGATHAASRTKRVVVQFPIALYEETRNAVNELHTNQTVLIRSAVELYLEQRKQEKLELQLAEGYAANASLARQTTEVFASVDADF